jgi:hypothetical protein
MGNTRDPTVNRLDHRTDHRIFYSIRVYSEFKTWNIGVVKIDLHFFYSGNIVELGKWIRKISLCVYFHTLQLSYKSVPDQCVPEQKVSDVPSIRQCVPWTIPCFFFIYIYVSGLSKCSIFKNQGITILMYRNGTTWGKVLIQETSI